MNYPTLGTWVTITIWLVAFISIVGAVDQYQQNDRITELEKDNKELIEAFNKLKEQTNNNIEKICEYEGYGCTIDGVRNWTD